jgi:hypothetical protein
MDQAEYDRQFRRQGIVVGVEPAVDGVEHQSITVDGQSVAPLRIRMINSTPQQRYEKEMLNLQEHVEVVGHIEGGVDLVRRTGGADYAGNDGWKQIMRRFRRLQ